jgi:hypothetical protein
MNDDKVVRPSITIFAVFTLLQTFGQALGGIATELITNWYKFPVSQQLSGWITVVVTVPLQLAAISYAIKKGWIKIE